VEGGEDVETAFVADDDPAEPAEQGQLPLDDPAMLAELLAALDLPWRSWA
jgi:hypothetical protein